MFDAFFAMRAEKSWGPGSYAADKLNWRKDGKIYLTHTKKQIFRKLKKRLSLKPTYLPFIVIFIKRLFISCIKSSYESPRNWAARLSPCRTRSSWKHCCRGKCFPVKLRGKHMSRKQILLLGDKKTFLPQVKIISPSREQILLPKHMFPNLVAVKANLTSFQWCSLNMFPSNGEGSTMADCEV